MTAPTRRFFLRKSQKLRAPTEFERVYDRKQKAGDDRLLVFAARRSPVSEERTPPPQDNATTADAPLAPEPNAPAEDLSVTRFGLSVSRKQGGAVRRARLKRLLREAFRLSQHDLPERLDLVLIPRQGVQATTAEFAESLVRLTRRLAQRLAKES